MRAAALVCQDSKVLLYSTASGIPAVGVGVMVQPDGEILALAQQFVQRAGSIDPVLLAMATGRVVSRGVRVPRLNTSARFIVTPREWWITDRLGGASYAHGSVRKIVGAFTTTSGLAVALSETKSAQFQIGEAHGYRAKALLESVLGHARLCSSSFENIAPGQPPLMFVGTYVGGRRTGLQPGEECVLAVSGLGVCATGLGPIFLRPAAHLREVHVDGVGGHAPGAGWAAVAQLGGPATANLMNMLTMRRHVDCLVRFAFDDAEAVFALTGDTPQRIQVDASALVGALRAPAAVPGVEDRRQPSVERVEGVEGVEDGGDPVDQAVGRFCGFCGARRSASHAFCTGCGRAYEG